MEETILFIDEGYVSFISKFFGKGKPLKNRIENFAQKIANEKNLLCKEIYFYIAPPPYQSPKPTHNENLRKANYDRFIKKLKDTGKIHVREGRCQKDEKGDYHQKGVDTLLTMDLLKIAQRANVRKIILITADTDFVPIIEEIRKDHNVQVILAYFTDKRRKSAFSLSNHLWDVCDDRILIKMGHFGI